MARKTEIELAGHAEKVLKLAKDGFSYIQIVDKMKADYGFSTNATSIGRVIFKAKNKGKAKPRSLAPKAPTPEIVPEIVPVIAESQDAGQILANSFLQAVKMLEQGTRAAAMGLKPLPLKEAMLAEKIANVIAKNAEIQARKGGGNEQAEKQIIITIVRGDDNEE